MLVVRIFPPTLLSLPLAVRSTHPFLAGFAPSETPNGSLGIPGPSPNLPILFCPEVQGKLIC